MAIFPDIKVKKLANIKVTAGLLLKLKFNKTRFLGTRPFYKYSFEK